MLVYRHFQYLRHRKSTEDYTFWKCRSRDKYNCKATLKTKDDKVVDDQHAFHTHAPTPIYDGAEQHASEAMSTTEQCGGQASCTLDDTDVLFDGKIIPRAVWKQMLTTMN